VALNTINKLNRQYHEYITSQFKTAAITKLLRYSKKKRKKDILTYQIYLTDSTFLDRESE
jgi:hypothetical protein